MLRARPETHRLGRETIAPVARAARVATTSVDRNIPRPNDLEPPSSSWSRSAPSGSIPSKRPRDHLVVRRMDGERVPIGCARVSQAWASSNGSLVRHSLSSRSKLPASSGAKACGVTRPESDAHSRSGRSGADARFTPKPMTTRSPLRSRRIPASFRPSSSTSFGHLSISACPGTARSIASMSARPATSESVCGCGSPVAQLDDGAAVEIAAGATPIAGPAVPCPASCSSATSQSPSTAVVSAIRSALVEPVRSTIRMRLRRAIPRRGR